MEVDSKKSEMNFLERVSNKRIAIEMVHVALDVWEEGIRSRTIVLRPRKRPRRREER